MAAAKSTRLSIVEQSLADILERLGDLTPNDANRVKLRELRTKALAYERTTSSWTANPPSEAQRQAMLKLVIELNVAVMETARAPAAPVTPKSPPSKSPSIKTRTRPPK